MENNPPWNQIVIYGLSVSLNGEDKSGFIYVLATRNKAPTEISLDQRGLNTGSPFSIFISSIRHQPIYHNTNGDYGANTK